MQEYSIVGMVFLVWSMISGTRRPHIKGKMWINSRQKKVVPLCKTYPNCLKKQLVRTSKNFLSNKISNEDGVKIWSYIHKQ